MHGRCKDKYDNKQKSELAGAGWSGAHLESQLFPATQEAEAENHLSLGVQG